MKKSELKKVLKPLIKECIKEVLLEDGVLSNVVSEVFIGLSAGTTVLEESKSSFSKKTNTRPNVLEETRKKMLEAVGKSS